MTARDGNDRRRRRTVRPGPAGGGLGAVGAGTAVLLVGTAASAVVQGTSWVGYAALTVALVVGAGLLLRRAHAAAVTAVQALGVLVLACALFSDSAPLGVLPTPAALGDLGTLALGATAQIDTGIAPVSATPEILLLVTAAFGVLTIAVYAVAVLAGAPAAAAVPLLAVFAVPTALADELLPTWVLVASAAGFLVLLTVRDGMRHRLPGAAALAAVAVVLALIAGASAQMIGTAGRFGEGSGPAGRGGAIGLSPFAALRGQLEQPEPVELFRVTGLPRPAYLRALTLRDYVPDLGWQLSRPDPGVPLDGPLPSIAPPGETVEIRIENRAFRDYWLPVYDVPLAVSGVTAGTWSYDGTAGIAYSNRPRREDAWTQQAQLSEPSAAQLRAAEGTAGVDPAYLDVSGVDPRVAEIATAVTAGRPTGFDRAMALLDYFTGPSSTFRYDLRTAPGAGDDALVEFLTVGRAGYCEQFASAMAVMLRTVGVPARVAVGFTAGTDAGDHRTVTTADAHAWVEAWFPGVGWTVFDPTPLTDGRAVIPPYVSEARREEAADTQTQPEPGDLVPGSAPEQQPQAQAPMPEEVPPEPQAAPETGSDVPLWPVLVPLLLVAGGLVPAALRNAQRRRRLAAVAAGGPDAAGAAWAELLAESVDRGASTRRTDTVRGAARRLVRDHHLDEDAQQGLREIVRAVEATWYGGGEAAPGELAGPLDVVRRGIAAGSPLTLRARLYPRSLTDGRTALRHDEEALTGHG